MDVIPRNDYGERCQFDAYCKLVLYHEAIDYLREMQRRRDRELSFSDLPQAEMDKLYTVDRYPSDRITFSSHGYTPALNAHTALRGAPTSMGRGEIPVELMPSAVRFLPIYSSFMAAWNDSLCCCLKKGR